MPAEPNRPFRWDLVRPDQLGSLLDGIATPTLPFLDKLVDCAGRVLAQSAGRGIRRRRGTPPTPQGGEKLPNGGELFPSCEDGPNAGSPAARLGRGVDRGGVVGSGVGDAGLFAGGQARVVGQGEPGDF